MDPQFFLSTIKAFNSHIDNAVAKPNFAQLDSCRTKGLDVEKSHWAMPLDKPPFFAYPLKPGITFTYMGLLVDSKGKILLDTNKESSNIFAAGEIIAGNILRSGYLAGFGLTIGSVFGTIAGRAASESA